MRPRAIFCSVRCLSYNIFSLYNENFEVHIACLAADGYRGVYVPRLVVQACGGVPLGRAAG